MITGITFGVFDYTHIGHINLMKNAKKHCDLLIVCASDDEYVEKKKGHKPTFTLKERMDALKELESVDLVDVQSLYFGKKELINKYKPEIIFVGDDWNEKTFEGSDLGVEVKFLPRTKKISSTKMRG